MEELKLSELINDITYRKIPYCLVCFRLETERKLVRPKAVADFLRTTSTPKYAKDKWVCYICERQAERAMRLFRTMRIARDVSMAVWNLAEKNYSSERVLQVLPVHLSINSNRRKEVSPEKLMETIRRHGNLTQTNVLVVNTQGILEVDPLQTENDIVPDTIVLDDDEETRTKDTPKLVPIEKLLEPPQLAAIAPAPQPNTQTVLLQPENSSSLYLCTLPVNFPQIPIPTVVQNNELVIDPSVQLNNSSKPRNVMNNDKKTSNTRNVNIACKPGPLSQKKNIQINEAQTLTADLELNTAINSIMKDGDGNICFIENPVSLKETVDVTDDPHEPPPTETKLLSKPAVMTSSRIDWEDKIPMDVISFVDANDPNAGDVLDGMTIVPDRNKPNPPGRKRKAQRDVINVD